MFDWFQLGFQLDLLGWVYLILVVTFGSFIVGATGFGAGIVRVPLLLQIFSLKVITPIENLLGFMNYLDLRAEMAKSQKHKVFFPLVIGNFIGAIIGTIILIKFGTNIWLIRILGGIILLYQIRFLIRLNYKETDQKETITIPKEDLFIGHGWSELKNNFGKYIKPDNLAHVLVGIISGVMSSTFAIGGPPIVIYLERMIKDKAVLRSTIMAFFFINGYIQLTVLFFSQQINLQLVFTCFILFPFMGIGNYLGSRQAKEMSHKQYQIWIAVIIILASLFLIYRSF
jgi:uncharacterized membrane protein YfcA